MSGGGVSGEDKVMDLVGPIYDAALDAQLWPDIEVIRPDEFTGTAFYQEWWRPAGAVPPKIDKSSRAAQRRRLRSDISNLGGLHATSLQ